MEKKNNLIGWILDATEKMCIVFLVVILWLFAILFVAVGIVALFNLF